MTTETKRDKCATCGGEIAWFDPREAEDYRPWDSKPYWYHVSPIDAGKTDDYHAPLP